jgi:hypothetical protein
MMRRVHSLRCICMTYLDAIFITIRAKSVEMNKTSSVSICAGEFVIPSEKKDVNH